MGSAKKQVSITKPEKHEQSSIPSTKTTHMIWSLTTSIALITMLISGEWEMIHLIIENLNWEL